MSPSAPVEVAIAILYQNGQFLMQLRDDNPAIRFPGRWGLCGGHLEPGEDSDRAMRRELLEEIGFCPPQLTLFCRTISDTVIRNTYHAPLTVGIEELMLGEGVELAWVPVSAIQAGAHYSTTIRETRLLGAPHQALLLNFIAAHDESTHPTV